MKRLCQLLFVLSFVSALVAQQATKAPEAFTAPSQKIYKVNFVIYELEDGKRINERSYTIPINTVDNKSRTGWIRVGTRVPVTVKEKEFQYLDVGLRIDCEVTEQAGKIILSSTIEISNFVLPDQNADPRSGGNPIMRNIQQRFVALLSPGKPSLVTSIDDINSKKRLQVEATVTRVE